jgi:hypothetical protein
MRTIATVLLLAIGLQVSAQKECATAAYTQHITTDAATRQRMADVETFLQQQKTKIRFGIAGQADNKAAETVIRIPVVVHVLYNNAAQNISDERIKSQIDALNRDFRRRNNDTAATPERFKPFAADMAIEFVLATTDPSGKATNGIVRKQTSASYFTMDDKMKSSKTGGSDAWDTKSYLNIWVGNLRQVLGYASMPGTDAALDGVVINLSAFGTQGTAAPYHLGRTTVHEVGHWLGLKHIWGDAACGDDGVSDTPKQGSYTTGNPTGFRSSCSNAPLGDMYMNYMDFTNDDVMNLFTHGQKERMRALFLSGGARNGILTSKGLSGAIIEESVVATPVPVVTPPVMQAPEKAVVTKAAFQTYPNPAVAELTLKTEEAWMGKEVQLVNMNGTVLQRVIITSGEQKLNVDRLPAGVYFLQGFNGQARISQKLVKM